MAKFSNPSKLSKEEQEKLFLNFCRALSQLKNPIEAAQFLKDLLSVQEAEMLAKRLKAAEFLIGGKTYAEISRLLKISSSTISHVNEWLKISGDGYKTVIKRIPKEDKERRNAFEDKFNPLSWRSVKKRYPLYYWPELLLETIVEESKYQERRKLRTVLRTMDKKTTLFKKLDSLLNNRRNLKNS